MSFLLTHPSRGATSFSFCFLMISSFLLTHPSRGATRLQKKHRILFQFLLTHPSRGATHCYRPTCSEIRISTHTPLAGCDPSTASHSIRIVHFYSHTPRGVRQNWIVIFHLLLKFLLTHPSRGATAIFCVYCHQHHNIEEWTFIII